jgi:hypothetical protein
MSHRTNWGRLRTYLGSDENEQQELKVNKGAGFNPQINILTNRKGYQALNAALPSRIEGGVQFHDEEKPEVTKQKNAILGRIRDSLTEPQYAAFINQLSHTLLALEPRRDALRKQQSMQETIFKQRSLRGIKREEFETMSGDASFVKDISGVWLKTDIINFAIKSVQGNGAALKAMGMAVLRATQARQDEGTSAAAYDAGNTGWRARLIRMGRILFLEGQKQSKDHMSSTRKDALAAVRKADENSYSSLTYSLSDTLLGIRHDTFLREDLVEKAAQALKTKNDPDSTLISGFISDPKVLVELRTIGFTGQEKDDDEVRDKIAALIDNWKKEKL